MLNYSLLEIPKAVKFSGATLLVCGAEAQTLTNKNKDKVAAMKMRLLRNIKRNTRGQS